MSESVAEIVEEPTDVVEQTTEQEGQEGQQEVSPTAPEEPQEATPVPQDELTELRSLLRTMRAEQAALQNELSKAQQQKVDTPKVRILYDEDGNKVEVPLQQEPATPTTTQYDQFKADYEATLAAKEPVLDSLREVMSFNPAYKDLDSVLTIPAVESVYDKLATAHAERAGLSFAEARLAVQTAVLRQANPFKYLYNIIKSNQPKPVTKKPAQVPVSLEQIAGGSKEQTAGWTASRIDALDVSELKTVPRDIYDKYLRGELK